MNWITFTGTWAAFMSSGRAKPGVEVQLEDGRELLIGHVNELGGGCDDCPEITRRDVVVAFRTRVSL
jgi:hypothetical protein